MTVRGPTIKCSFLFPCNILFNFSCGEFKKNDQHLLNLEKNCLGGVKSELAFPIGKKVKHVAFNGQKTYKMLYTTTNSGAKKSKSNSSDSKLLHTVVKLSRNFLEGQPVIIFLMALSVMSKISLPDTLL